MTGIDKLLDNPQLVIEGKTKRVFYSSTQGEVLIESKDDITAGDGEYHDRFDGKGELANETTANVFELLQSAGIPTHFIGRHDERTFQALEVQMIPIELVARRLAFGSYLKRNPNAAEESVFETVEFEMFSKDDENHDPFLEYDFEAGTVTRYKPKQPLDKADSVIDKLSITDSKFGLTSEQIAVLSRLTTDTFTLLEAAWNDQGVVLVDLKIECGVTEEGEIVVADVIDNDSWRIWPGGDASRMLDKEVYRKLINKKREDFSSDEEFEEHKEKTMALIEANYTEVAEATGQFN